MRSLLGVLLICGLAVGGTTGATANVPSSAALYEGMGPDGVLTVVGPAGTPVCALDSFGFPVAGGVVSNGALEMYAPNAGPDAEGVLLRVFAGNEMFTVNGYDDWWL